MTGFDIIGNVNVAIAPLGQQLPPNVVRVHPPEQCAGEWCCIHNPSDHPLREAPLNFRFDTGITERICPHGVGHPDPDSMAFRQRALPPEVFKALAMGVHGCDGCCARRKEQS